ncbi:MAG: TonB-dependent siderophore receptor [Pseudomonadota bacterium]
MQNTTTRLSLAITIAVAMNMLASDHLRAEENLSPSAEDQATPPSEPRETNAEAPQEIEEVVVTGQLSRFSALKADTPIIESARSLSIETEQQIIDKGFLVLDDAFAYSAGVTAEPFGFATRSDSVAVRGLQVPQYQDSLQSLFGNFNNARPDIYTLEQVEVLKGPASVLFGRGSPGGLVNVISKRPRETADQEFILELGNFNRVQLAFDSTGPLSANGDWLYRLVAVYRDTDTQVDFVSDETIVVAPSITWRPTEATDITFLVNYRDTESDTAAQFLPREGTLVPAPNGAFVDFGHYSGDPDYNRYDADTTAVTLLANHEFNRIWSLELTSRYTDGSADYQQTWGSFLFSLATPNDLQRWVFNEDGTLYEDGTVPRTFFRSDASSEQFAVDTRLRADFFSGSIEHNLLIGAQYQDITNSEAGYNAYALGYNIFTGQPSAPFFDAFWINMFDPQYGNIPDQALFDSLLMVEPDQNTDDFGLYINDQLSIGNWRLTLGVRYDSTTTDTGVARAEDDEWSYATGLLYQFDSGWSPYASFATSFEPVVGDNGAGEPLRPQEGEQVEIGVKYEPQGFPALFTLAAFDLRQTNLPDPANLPGEFEQQRGEAKVRGVEFEGQAFLGNVQLELNLTWLDTESANGFRLASVPEQSASAWALWRPSGTLDGFRLGGGVRYVGENYGGFDIIRTPSYTLGDLLIGYSWRDLDFALNVRNVTDEEYLSTCLAQRNDCFPGDRRTVVGRVAYRF